MALRRWSMDKGTLTSSLGHLWHDLNWLGDVDGDGLLPGGVDSDISGGELLVLGLSADVLRDGIPLLLVGLDSGGKLRDSSIIFLVLLSEHLVDLGRHVGGSGLVGGSGVVGDGGLIGLSDHGSVCLLGQESGLLL